jgi:hypothetical protein
MIDVLQKVSRDRKVTFDDEDDDDMAPIGGKCKCVHGTCAPGKTTCNKCDAGWTGKLCDIPKNDKSSLDSKIIQEDDDLEAILKPRRIMDEPARDRDNYDSGYQRPRTG